LFMSYSIVGVMSIVYNVPIPLHILTMFEQEGFYLEQIVYNHRRRMFEGMHYLPIIYLIPDEIAEKRGFADFPRDPYIAATDDKWWAVYHSQPFQMKLMDTIAWMMWQSIGIKGGIDNYSIRNPITIMVYDLGMWVWLLSQIGITTDTLAEYPHGEEMPFLTMEEAAELCEGLANAFWNHPDLKMRKVHEIVKTHPAHADYSSRPSHAKMDFYRQYYHTRAKTKIEPIVSGYSEDGEEEIVYAPYTPSGFAEVETRLWFDGFLEQLNEKDRQIIKQLEHNENYKAHKAVYKKYKDLTPKKDTVALNSLNPFTKKKATADYEAAAKKHEAYRAKHADAIGQYEAACDYFAAVMNGRTELPITKWQTEQQQLLKKRYGLCEHFYTLKDEIKSAETIRRSMEQLMQDEPQRTSPTRTQGMDR